MIRDKSFHGKGLQGEVAFHRIALYPPSHLRVAAAFILLLLLLTAAMPALGREKDVRQYGAGLIVNIPLPEPEVAQVVEDVAQNGIIRGTKEYNKDEYITGAVAATSTPVFAAWTEGGKVFYLGAGRRKLSFSANCLAAEVALSGRERLFPQPPGCSR